MSQETYSNQKETFDIYCNSLQLAFGIHDVTFNLFQELPNNKKIHHGTMTMSPQHAKVLCYMLQEHIQNYEKIFGEIPTPPSKEKIEELTVQGVLNFENEPR